jgi:hypothetical protein
MNPIEPAWSKLETYLRARAARTREALEATIPDALRTSPPMMPKAGSVTQAMRQTFEKSALVSADRQRASQASHC